MPDNLEEGREHFRRRAWRDAYRSLSRADRSRSLGAADLEMFASSAYLSGREDVFEELLKRGYQEHRGAGQELRAARCAFWLGLTSLLRGATGQGSGWLSRAKRLVAGEDCVEQGYLLLATAEVQLAAGELAGAHVAAVEAVDTGMRFQDADVVCCARHIQGRALIHMERVQAGLALLDEAMLGAISDELSPIMTGLIYCSLVDACREVFAVERAREWTAALSKWCDQQPQLVAFSGVCLLHRARIEQLSGAWQEADAELLRARERFSLRDVVEPPGMVFYEQAELQRLRGAFAEAEEGYRTAARLGSQPQPGLALLRMTQGRADAACASIRRALFEVTQPLQRARLLPACVEILLHSGEVEAARPYGQELSEIAQRYDTPALHAMAAHASGSLALADGDPRSALVFLRRAFDLWRDLQAPYEVARTRVQLGLACRAVGDEEAGEMELAAAREAFEQLGAPSDLRGASTGPRRSGHAPHGLSARELEVLRLVAKGNTNKAIAAELHLSERTVDRHVSNILTKLNVASRVAATAYAYRHELF